MFRLDSLTWITKGNRTILNHSFETQAEATRLAAQIVREHRIPVRVNIEPTSPRTWTIEKNPRA